MAEESNFRFVLIGSYDSVTYAGSCAADDSAERTVVEDAAGNAG